MPPVLSAMMSGELEGWLAFLFVGALVVVGIGLSGRAPFALGGCSWGLASRAICLGEALTGHARLDAAAVSLSVAADVAHVLAAGGWIGGLACLVMCGLPALGTVEHGAPRRRRRAARSSVSSCGDRVRRARRRAARSSPRG